MPPVHAATQKTCCKASAVHALPWCMYITVYTVPPRYFGRAFWEGITAIMTMALAVRA